MHFAVRLLTAPNAIGRWTATKDGGTAKIGAAHSLPTMRNLTAKLTSNILTQLLKLQEKRLNRDTAGRDTP